MSAHGTFMLDATRKTSRGLSPSCRLATGIAVAVPISGCGFAPSVNILGSFFPAWLLCIVIGVVLTIISLRVLLAMQVAQHLGPAAVVYPCLAALWIFATWLVVFGS